MAFAMDRSKKLGRGLKSLLGEPEDGADVAVMTEDAPAGAEPSRPEPAEPAAPAGERIVQLVPEAIRPNPFQPRTEFDEAGLAELADSMKTCGILSPLLVRRSADGGYELIAGERRLRAAKRAGLEKVPVVVRPVTDAEALEQALIENIQRRDLNAMEKAKALSEYLVTHKLSQVEAEKRLGMSRSELANHIRLLRLTPPVQEAVRSGALSYGHARALVAVEDPARQGELAKQVIAEQLSVRTLEDLVKGPSEPALPAAPDAAPGAKAKSKDAQIRELEDEFSQVLGVKVTIKAGRKGDAGTITIPYGSLDDFDRIRTVITGETSS